MILHRNFTIVWQFLYYAIFQAILIDIKKNNKFLGHYGDKSTRSAAIYTLGQPISVRVGMTWRDRRRKANCGGKMPGDDKTLLCMPLQNWLNNISN